MNLAKQDMTRLHGLISESHAIVVVAFCMSDTDMSKIETSIMIAPRGDDHLNISALMSAVAALQDRITKIHAKAEN